MNKTKETLFEESYRTYANLLLKIIYSYIQNYEDGQDILQEVFYRLLYKAPKFKNEEHKKNWLIKVAMNLSKDYLKNFWQSKTEGLSDEFTGISGQEKCSVRELILQLPPKYKEVIMLHYLCGYSVSEIGAMLALGESAVKMRLKRGREILKVELEEA